MKTNQEKETEIYRSAPPGLPAKEWHFPKPSKGESARKPLYSNDYNVPIYAKRTIRKLEAQRDELLAACKYALDCEEDQNSKLAKALRAAIQHVQEAQQ